MKKSEEKRKLWTERIQARTASGENRKAYCRSLGVHPSTMLYWEKRLKESAAPKAVSRRRGRFARIRMVPEARTSRTVVRLSGGMAIECEGWPDARWLGEVSRAISRDSEITRP